MTNGWHDSPKSDKPQTGNQQVKKKKSKKAATNKPKSGSQNEKT